MSHKRSNSASPGLPRTHKANRVTSNYCSPPTTSLAASLTRSTASAFGVATRIPSKQQQHSPLRPTTAPPLVPNASNVSSQHIPHLFDTDDLPPSPRTAVAQSLLSKYIRTRGTGALQTDELGIWLTGIWEKTAQPYEDAELLEKPHEVITAAGLAILSQVISHLPTLLKGLMQKVLRTLFLAIYDDYTELQVELEEWCTALPHKGASNKAKVSEECLHRRIRLLQRQPTYFKGHALALARQSSEIQSLAGPPSPNTAGSNVQHVLSSLDIIQLKRSVINLSWKTLHRATNPTKNYFLAWRQHVIGCKRKRQAVLVSIKQHTKFILKDSWMKWIDFWHSALQERGILPRGARFSAGASSKARIRDMEATINQLRLEKLDYMERVTSLLTNANILNFENPIRNPDKTVILDGVIEFRTMTSLERQTWMEQYRQKVGREKYTEARKRFGANAKGGYDAFDEGVGELDDGSDEESALDPNCTVQAKVKQYNKDMGYTKAKGKAGPVNPDVPSTEKQAPQYTFSVLSTIDFRKRLVKNGQFGPRKDTLLAWVNTKLADGGYSLEVVNFSTDFSDGRAYLSLMSAVSPGSVLQAVSSYNLHSDFVHKMPPKERVDLFLTMLENLTLIEEEEVSVNSIIHSNEDANKLLIAKLFVYDRLVIKRGKRQQRAAELGALFAPHTREKETEEETTGAGFDMYPVVHRSVSQVYSSNDSFYSKNTSGDVDDVTQQPDASAELSDVCSATMTSGLQQSPDAETQTEDSHLRQAAKLSQGVYPNWRLMSDSNTGVRLIPASEYSDQKCQTNMGHKHFGWLEDLLMYCLKKFKSTRKRGDEKRAGDIVQKLMRVVFADEQDIVNAILANQSGLHLSTNSIKKSKSFSMASARSVRSTVTDDSFSRVSKAGDEESDATTEVPPTPSNAAHRTGSGLPLIPSFVYDK